MKKALIVYWSKTGNTKKVAKSIRQGLEKAGLHVTIKQQHEAEDEDFFDYDLVCIGAPAYSWHPPEPVDKYLKSKFGKYRQSGKIKPSAPKIPDKNALIFVTYSVLTRALMKLRQQASTWHNSLNIWVSPSKMNGAFLASSMARWRTAQWAGWAT